MDKDVDVAHVSLDLVVGDVFRVAALVSEEEEEEGEGEVVDEEGGGGVPQEEETVGEFESQLESHCDSEGLRMYRERPPMAD